MFNIVRMPKKPQYSIPILYHELFGWNEMKSAADCNVTEI